MTGQRAELLRTAPLPSAPSEHSPIRISRRGLITFLAYNAVAGGLAAEGKSEYNDAQALENSIHAQAIAAGSKEGSPSTQDAVVLATRTELKNELKSDVNSQRLNGTLTYGLSGLMFVGEAVYLGAKAILHLRTRQNRNDSSNNHGPKRSFTESLTSSSSMLESRPPNQMS